MSGRVLNQADAIAEAIYNCMRDDPKMALIWGSLGGLGGKTDAARRLREDFKDRIVHPPISEAAICAVAVGAALGGVRSIVPMGTASFMFRAWDQILHEAGTAHYMSNGRVTAPVVFHVMHGLRGGGAAQHSQSPQAMLWNSPGLEIAMPSTPADAKGLMTTAIKSENPTVFLEHQKLMRREGAVPEGDYAIPFGVADVKRAGGDVTIVAISLQVVDALAAAETLSAEGIEAEVVDLRTLAPFDEDAVLKSLAKTGRLVVADECPPRCSVASEIIALAAEKGFGLLKAPPVRVNRRLAHTAFSKPLEDHIAPGSARIVEAARGVCAWTTGHYQ